jgi:predicted GIY-YIG superfamily endonuclease
METRTIQQLINDDYPKGSFYVYAFRSGYDYLYIGESQNAQYRVSEHLLGKRSNSSLQRALSTNRCSHWVVDFIGANKNHSTLGDEKR